MEKIIFNWQDWDANAIRVIVQFSDGMLRRGYIKGVIDNTFVIVPFKGAANRLFNPATLCRLSAVVDVIPECFSSMTTTA